MTGKGGSLRRTITYALLALPLALTPVRTRLRVPRRLLHEPVSAHGVSAVRCVFHSVLSAGVGIVAWFLIMLTALGLVRGLAYPLVAAATTKHRGVAPLWQARGWCTRRSAS